MSNSLINHNNNNNTNMNVVKRDGRSERISFDKILRRIEHVCEKLNLTRINPVEIAKETINGLYNGITTEEIDHYAATKCAEKIQDDPQYDNLAAGLCVSRLHKMTSSNFINVTESLYNNVDTHGEHNPLVNDKYYNFVKQNIDNIQKALMYDRDYDFDFFGFKTLERSYLQRVRTLEEIQNNKAKVLDRKSKNKDDSKIMKQKFGSIVERPQSLFMRVALALNVDDIDNALILYNYLSNRKMIFGSPTMYNAGAKIQQCSSCYLINMEDSIEGIGETMMEAMKISKWAGGIGIHVSKIRGKSSLIRKTNGESDGIIKMIKVFNEIGRYVNQGGKRNGAIAIYLEPWHVDVFDFCDLKKNNGSEEMRARDIFLALWVPDIFMKRVEEDGMWSLMCPDECPNLTTTFGEDFDELYLKYESAGKYRRQVKASELWYHILAAQSETGMPYMCFKDNVNRQSNQKNIGVIQSSNLCVSGDTYVLTDVGQVQIRDIVDTKVNVWNGFEWSEVDIKQTGVNQELMLIKFSNGVELKCTSYHKFYIVDHSGHTSEIRAKDLKVGNYLIKYKLPSELSLGNSSHLVDDDKDYNLNKVPLTATSDYKLKWLDEYRKQNGNNDEFKNSKNINSLDKEFLLQFRLMAQTLGTDSTVEYSNNKTYNLKLLAKNHIHDNKVIDICYLGEDKKEDTYCFTEPKRHMGMFNGILTGNCAEIVEYSDVNETAVCNLSSICLHRFVSTDSTGKLSYNYADLCATARVVTRNLNNVIDINYYPVDKAKKSNMRHRPIGVGVQGLADVYCMFDIPFDSEEARELNKRIFETIYYGCLLESCDLAKKYGAYDTFKGSPFSQGLLQFHLWGMSEDDLLMGYDWESLIEDIKTYGTRNSLLTALMPTASTSQIMGSNECFEPMTQNLYTRSTLAGEYVVVNRYLIEKLIKLGLWNDEIRDEFKYDKGSLQNIDCIPDDIKKVYTTAFEMKSKPIIQQSIERGPFIDQSQSMNIFCKTPDFDMLTSAFFYGWRNKIKTGMYYLRTQPAVSALEFGLDAEKIKKIQIKRGEIVNDEQEDNNSDHDESNVIVAKVGNKKAVKIDCDSCGA